MPEQVLISVPDFLRLYAISRTSFYEEVKKKTLPILKRGRRTFVASNDAAAWVEALRNSRS